MKSRDYWIAIDFDGTLVQHDFPRIGQQLPWAFLYLKVFKKLGVKLILNTMRSDECPEGPVLSQAVEFCRARGIEFDGVNENPTQWEWTKSPKADADLYIDDKGFGIPLMPQPNNKRFNVNWSVVGPSVLQLIEPTYRIDPLSIEIYSNYKWDKIFLEFENKEEARQAAEEISQYKNTGVRLVDRTGFVRYNYVNGKRVLY